MSETIISVENAAKEDQYESLYPQMEALIGQETDPVANMANMAAALKQVFGFFWVGFYVVKDNSLVLGPFQGPVACTRIRYGRGVCGTAWQCKETVIVPDVDAFPGHIACNSDSKSEIVIPVLRDDKVLAVLDIDSDMADAFDETDALHLEKMTRLIAHTF
jgi:GAF domain-containing protein